MGIGLSRRAVLCESLDYYTIFVLVLRYYSFIVSIYFFIGWWLAQNKASVPISFSSLLLLPLMVQPLGEVNNNLVCNEKGEYLIPCQMNFKKSSTIQRLVLFCCLALPYQSYMHYDLF